MNSILDFIYFGSTNVQENQLTTFLVTANELKILGGCCNKKRGCGFEKYLFTYKNSLFCKFLLQYSTLIGLVETSNLQKNYVNHSPGNSKNDTIGIGANDHITIDDTENGITEQQQEKLGKDGNGIFWN